MARTARCAGRTTRAWVTTRARVATRARGTTERGTAERSRSSAAWIGHASRATDSGREAARGGEVRAAGAGFVAGRVTPTRAVGGLLSTGIDAAAAAWLRVGVPVQVVAHVFGRGACHREREKPECRKWPAHVPRESAKLVPRALPGNTGVLELSLRPRPDVVRMWTRIQWQGL